MLSSCFFFSCYGDHRDLHSFPTRRSSDLGGSRPSWVARSMSCAMRSTSARSCRQVASSFIRSLARTSALYSSLWPSNRPSCPAFWSITASSSRVGQQEPRPPEQVLAHHDLRPAVRPGQRRGLGRTPLVDLERDEASAGLEHPACAGEDGTGPGQPVPAAHQRLARLEQPHAGIETRVLRVREI